MTDQDIELSNDENDGSLSIAGSAHPKYIRFTLACLGSIPWVGSVIAASTALHAEAAQDGVNTIVEQWLKEHEKKIQSLGDTIRAIVARLDAFEGQVASEVANRINDDQYLALVHRGFRVWDRADTEEKKEYIRKCLCNAAATRICSDDVIRLFIDWIDRYDEIHFSIIRTLYHNRGATRGFIWEQIHGDPVREDSAEADLYKLLIFDLNTGRVLRQIREKNQYGQFLVKQSRHRRHAGGVLESAFEDTKPYELTQLGSQFVHYVMNEAAPQVGNSP